MKHTKIYLIGFIVILYFSFLLQGTTIISNEPDKKDNRNVVLPLTTSNSFVCEWNRTWGGADWDEGYGVAVDSSSNVYVAGNTRSFGAGYYDMVLVKYDGNGVQQWNRTWGGINNDRGNGVAVDSSSNVYCAGWTYSFGAGSYDMVLVNYDGNGVQQWNRTWGGGNADYGYGVAVDSSDNVYLVGETTSFGTGGDIVLVKYEGNGVQQWNRTWGGADYDRGRAVAIDSSDNVYVAGYIQSRAAGEDRDMVLVKYGPDIYNPIIIINSPHLNEAFGVSTPDFNIAIIEPNLHSTWYTIDNGATNITFSGLTGTINQTEWEKKGDGSVTIRFYANDSLGFKGFAEVTVQKDTIAPFSLITFIPYSGVNIVIKTTTFTLTADDGLGSGVSVIMYKINNSAWIAYTGPFNLSSYDYGDYLISYQAIDEVGNIETVRTELVKLVVVERPPSDEVVMILIIVVSIASVVGVGIATTYFIRKRRKIVE